MILVTGRAGFIDCKFLHDWFESGDEPVISLDALTYAVDRNGLPPLTGRVHKKETPRKRGVLVD